MMVLPAREAFQPESAGAIAMVVRRLATVSQDAVVVGAALQGQGFPGIRFRGLTGGTPWRYGVSVIVEALRARPALIEVHQQPRLALALARLLPQSRVMLFLHNDPLSMRGLRKAAARGRALARLHRVVCVSNHLCLRFATGLPASHKNLETLHNTLDLKEFQENRSSRRREILYAGRIVETKGVADFIEACREALPRLAGWQARIIGGDRFGPASPETPFFRAMRDQAKLNKIRFDGPQPHDFVLKAMAEAMIVVVPSRWPEPFGLTALEAMASGAALIASRSGGLPEVAGEAALYVEPGDAAALARAIVDLAQDEAAREARARAGRERARLFDLPVIAARLKALRGVAQRL